MEIFSVRQKVRTFSVLGCVFHLETVTVTVLFMNPAFVTIPVNLSGGMLVQLYRLLVREAGPRQVSNQIGTRDSQQLTTLDQLPF